MTSAWVVGILSTDYDLHEYREKIIMLLKNKGVIPSAFENPDFPVAVGVHSHDACLAALERVDAAILFIDKRAGGVYFGTGEDISITEQEYIEVAKSKKPYFVFVSKGAWNERHVYRTQLKASGRSKEEFDADYTCSYVTSISVVHFIDRIQNAFSIYGTSNWIYQFDGIDDLAIAVASKLEGLTQYYCYKIAEQQAEVIRNRKTSTDMMLSLGDVFSRGYYVEPDFSVVSGSLPVVSALNDEIVSTIQSKHSTLVIGEAGYGKTTILAKSFLTHFDKCPTTTYDIPFYINLKSMGSNYHFEFSQYINECFASNLEKEPYPFIKLDSIKPNFYLDSFDEIAEKITLQDLHCMSLSSMFNRPFLLTCRSQFAMRYIRSSEFAGKISNVIRVNKWDPDKAAGYTKNFCDINGKPELLKNIEGLLSKNLELSNILDNPLLVTMLLWVIEQNGLKIPATINNRVQLFSECLKELAFREIERLAITEISKETMLSVWAFAAWEVYYAKIRQDDIRYSDLLPKLKAKFPELTGINELWFEALFISTQINIVGTFHEQFLEYLSAYAILSSCVASIYPFPEFLGEVIRPEINRYFRALWCDKSDADKEQTLCNIKKLYSDKLLSDERLSIMQRIHAIYHLSRMKFQGNTEFINNVLSHEPNISVKISLYFGAIKLGLLDKEEELYQHLVTNAEYSDSNRGYHLAYYGDIVASDKLPFKDNTSIQWGATLNAFLRHFESTKDEHYFLWRIDLLTIRQLVIARNSPTPIDSQVLLKVRELIYNPTNKNFTKLQRAIESEYNELCTCINSISLN